MLLESWHSKILWSYTIVIIWTIFLFLFIREFLSFFLVINPGNLFLQKSFNIFIFMILVFLSNDRRVNLIFITKNSFNNGLVLLIIRVTLVLILKLYWRWILECLITISGVIGVIIGWKMGILWIVVLKLSHALSLK